MHILTWKRDWRLALWAAKSFYYFAQVDWPIVFHDGGALGADVYKTLLHHFPNGKVIGWDEATALVESRLMERGYAHLIRARIGNVLIRKLVDFPILAQASNVVVMDPDVLFVGRPIDLVSLGESELECLYFNRDSHSMYSINSKQARDWFGLDLPDKVNSGLGVFPVKEIDLAFLNDVLASARVPAAADVFPEQTAFALLAAKLGPAYLPDAYSVATGTPVDLAKDKYVSRHYVTPVRRLYYEEGIPHLMQYTQILGES